MPQHMAAVATITCETLPSITTLGHCDLSADVRDQHPEMLRQKLLTHYEYQVGCQHLGAVVKVWLRRRYMQTSMLL